MESELAGALQGEMAASVAVIVAQMGHVPTTNGMTAVPLAAEAKTAPMARWVVVTPPAGARVVATATALLIAALLFAVAVLLAVVAVLHGVSRDA
jgi:hypothetical protein